MKKQIKLCEEDVAVRYRWKNEYPEENMLHQLCNVQLEKKSTL